MIRKGRFSLKGVISGMDEYKILERKYLEAMKTLIDLRFYAKIEKRKYIMLKVEEITGMTFQEAIDELGK